MKRRNLFLSLISSVLVAVAIVTVTIVTVIQPKKKNIRHVRRMNYIDPEIDARLNGTDSLNNEDISIYINCYCVFS